MASFPVVQGTNTSTTASATSHSVSLPSGIIAGERLLVFFLCDAGRTVDTPSGWTKDFDNGTNGVRRLVGYSKIAAGSDSLTITTSASTASAHLSYRIQTNNNTVYSTTATGTVTADPPNLSPGTSQKYMWFAVAAVQDSSSPTYPTNYSNNQLVAQISSFGLLSATYSNEASSENPGTYTVTTAGSWVAATIAIEEQDPILGSFNIITQNSDIIQPTISYAAQSTFDLITSPSSIFQPTAVARNMAQWRNNTKVSSTITNKQK